MNEQKKFIRFFVLILVLIGGLSLGSVTNSNATSSACGQCEVFDTGTGEEDEFCNFYPPGNYSWGCTGNNGWYCITSPFCGGGPGDDT
jgi:hypothetical protein